MLVGSARNFREILETHAVLFASSSSFVLPRPRSVLSARSEIHRTRKSKFCESCLRVVRQRDIDCFECEQFRGNDGVCMSIDAIVEAIYAIVTASTIDREI